MPVVKYRSIEEQGQLPWHEPGDPENLERVIRLMALAAWLYPLERPRGVHRFRTIEEAAAWRATWKPRARPEASPAAPAEGDADR